VDDMSWLSKWEPKIAGAITSKELIPVLRRLAPGAQLIFDDNTYFIPSDPADVMAKIRSWSFTYWRSTRDCDDMVRIFRGRLSEKNFGNLLAMDTTFWYFSQSKQKKVLHKAITFLHNDELIFGEPQTGKLVEYEQVKIARLIV